MNKNVLFKSEQTSLTSSDYAYNSVNVVFIKRDLE